MIRAACRITSANREATAMLANPTVLVWKVFARRVPYRSDETDAA